MEQNLRLLRIHREQINFAGGKEWQILPITNNLSFASNKGLEYEVVNLIKKHEHVSEIENGDCNPQLVYNADLSFLYTLDIHTSDLIYSWFFHYLWVLSLLVYVTKLRFNF